MCMYLHNVIITMYASAMYVVIWINRICHTRNDMGIINLLALNFWVVRGRMQQVLYRNFKSKRLRLET